MAKKTKKKKAAPKGVYAVRQGGTVYIIKGKPKVTTKEVEVDSDVYIPQASSSLRVKGKATVVEVDTTKSHTDFCASGFKLLTRLDLNDGDIVEITFGAIESTPQPASSLALVSDGEDNF